ncbi:hypothetical protein GCM10022224_053760 [Nonomuraea antimicrobica]|uniref:Uncharacterized protein n=1 Tax=Nonomuraea antimicrobica TaxID=561173 RepID=A0ABP7C982_9ACTN
MREAEFEQVGTEAKRCWWRLRCHGGGQGSTAFEVEVGSEALWGVRVGVGARFCEGFEWGCHGGG